MRNEAEPRESIIKKMPDRQTLEDFLKGFHQPPTVIFNSETGEFERVGSEVKPEEKPRQT